MTSGYATARSRSGRHDGSTGVAPEVEDTDEVVARRLWQLGRRLAREQAVIDQPEQRRRRAERRLAHLLAVARRQSALWRRRLADVNPDRCRIEDLERIPVLDRGELGTAWEELVTDGALRLGPVRDHLATVAARSGAGGLPRFADRWVLVQTSGTTGSPVVVPWSEAGWLRMALTAVRAAVPAGLAVPGVGSAASSLPGSQGAGIVAVFGSSPRQLSGAVAASWSSPGLPIVAVSANTDVEVLLDALLADPPGELRGYPSVLRRLAWAARRRGVEVPVRRLGTSGERLTPATAALLAECFGVAPVDAWGATEVGWIAQGVGHGCGRLGVLTVADDACIVEPVDAHDRPVPAGEWADAVLVTGLLNTALPIVRYRIEDRVRLVPGTDGALQVAGRRPPVELPRGLDPFELVDRIEALLPCADYAVLPGTDRLTVEVPAGCVPDAARRELATRLAHELGRLGGRGRDGQPVAVAVTVGGAPRLRASGKADRFPSGVEPAAAAGCARGRGPVRVRSSAGTGAGSSAEETHCAGRLLGWLDEPRSDRGIRVAAVDGSCTYTSYATLAGRVRRAAQALAGSTGQRPGRLLLSTADAEAFVTCFFGALLAGLVPVPIPPADVVGQPGQYQRQVRGVVGVTEPVAAVADASQVAHLEALVGDVLSPILCAEAVSPAVSDAGLDGRRPLTAWHESARGRPVADDLGGAPPLALMQCTSGSSGQVKVVPVTTAALEANVAAIARWLGLEHDAAVASWLPLHHDMGLVGCLLAPVVQQLDTTLLPPAAFVSRPASWLSLFAEYGATHSAVPAFALGYLARRIPPAELAGIDLSGVRAVVVGAERIDPHRLHACQTLLGRSGLRPGTLLPAYGLAEATLAVTGVPPGHPIRTLGFGSLGPAAVWEPVGEQAAVVGCGRPLEGVEVTVVPDAPGRGPEWGPTPASAPVGEIVVTGPSVAAGYVGGGNHLSRSRFVDRALYTGDAGAIVDGELFVVGRLGDAVKVRGRAVFAEDIDLALVRAGLPPARAVTVLGERHGQPVAVVAVEEVEPASLRRAADAVRRVAPDLAVDVRPVPRGTIGRTTSGKPQRSALWAALGAGGPGPSARASTARGPQ
jgi:acyl-CoA synthetase (AMP-forming)/AMP-acid ligase II